MKDTKDKINYDYVPDSLAREEISDIPVVKEIRIKKAKIKLKFSMISKVIVLFALGLLVIFRFARITELGYKTNDINSGIEEIILENNKLKVDIEKQINLSAIRERAENELNLRAPNESQVIFIETKITDRVDYFESEEKEKGVVESVLDWIKNFLGI